MCSGMDSRVPVSVVGVGSKSTETPRKAGKGEGQLAPLEAISSLVTRLLRTAQEVQLVDEKAPSEGEMGPLSAVSPGVGAERGHSVKEWVRVCFSCVTPGTWGEPMFTSGHFFSISATGMVGGCPKWPIWATRTDGTGLGSTPGNEGWSGREGQPPGPSGIKVRLTPAGELVARGDASRLDSCRWGSGSDLTGLRAHRLFCHWGAIPRRIVDRMNGSYWTALKGVGKW